MGKSLQQMLSESAKAATLATRTRPQLQQARSEKGRVYMEKVPEKAVPKQTPESSSAKP